MSGDDSFWADAQTMRHRAFGQGGGLSDQEIAREAKAQAIFFPALAGFRGAVREAAALSALMAQDFHHLQDALDDNAPGQIYWDERIAEERG